MQIHHDALYTEGETAAILRVSKSFLAKKRVTGGGPRFVKIGRAVRYSGAGLIDYQKAGTRFSTSEYLRRPRRGPDDQWGDGEERKVGPKAPGPPR